MEESLIIKEFREKFVYNGGSEIIEGKLEYLDHYQSEAIESFLLFKLEEQEKRFEDFLVVLEDKHQQELVSHKERIIGKLEEIHNLHSNPSIAEGVRQAINLIKKDI